MRYAGEVTADDLDALVARAQGGEVRAFEALVAGQLPRVRRFARAFAANQADADDLAQEALLRVFKSLGSFRWQSAFSTWLFAVVRSAFLDAGKGRAATRRALEQPLEARHAQQAGGERPDEQLEAAQERALVWEAVRRIPVEFRAALVLFDIEGCSYDEVAAVEGIAVGTVKSRLHRARAHLRRILEETAPGGVSGETTPEAGTRRPATSSHLTEP
jgi:RNA polymerase sigma-70 factor (ECF subfamily)